MTQRTLWAAQAALGLAILGLVAASIWRGWL